jgi:hypothetical protein
MRAWLAGLIVLAAIGFVIGTSIERHSSTHESVAQLRSEGATTTSTSTEPGAESAATHAAENGGAGTEPPQAGEAGESAAPHAAQTPATTGETHNELRPLGVNIEAVAFIVIACLASLALAALAWVRPRWLLGLLVLAGAMAVFGVLDVREAFHQSDERRTGLVILAVVIAVLHFAAAGLAAAMAARRGAAGPPGAAGTITA